ncbi:LOB domain-containing protein 36-like [Daucus carota subsp. sativus]|uniref:LOB domain-containing protein 36-like n=1 Tax=Daucus carota subsp. sativus TaxID=79200 RepID=UPI0007EF94B2|nr:PREDICTED: LOB domain-containing protein 36-like [Daucus carota subsp. sativus]
MSSSNSPCAACKLLRRKCTQECVFAPYFPPDQPQKFANVHKVFGASNVAKLLNDLPAVQREDAVNSLAYEADARLRDPIYGCVGLISILQHKLKQVQMELYNAKKELSTYIGPSAMLPILPAPGNFIPPYQHQQPSQMMPYNMQAAQMMGGSPQNVVNPNPLVIQQQQNYQQIMEAQQVAAVVAAAREQEMLRSYEQQQAVLTQQQGRHSDQVRYDATGQGTDHARGAVFNHMGVSAGMAPALGLGSFEGSYQTQQHTQNDQPHHELQATQTFLEEQQQQGLALAQPQQLDPTQQQQGLALAQPQQLDLQQQQQQQQQLPLQQHRDGSEEEE